MWQMQRKWIENSGRVIFQNTDKQMVCKTERCQILSKDRSKVIFFPHILCNKCFVTESN